MSKRFTYVKNNSISQYSVLPIQEIGGKTYHCQGVVNMLNKLNDENEQLKQRINNRLHYYRELYNQFDKNDGFSYNIAKRVIEDLEDILR